MKMKMLFAGRSRENKENERNERNMEDSARDGGFGGNRRGRGGPGRSGRGGRGGGRGVGPRTYASRGEMASSSHSFNRPIDTWAGSEEQQQSIQEPKTGKTCENQGPCLVRDQNCTFYT